MDNKNEALPQDIQNEILLRLPVKSLGKCICVSKKWAAIILEKKFRDRYFLQSMTRPRLLFKFSRSNDPNVLFHSVYQEKKPLLSSGQQQTCIALEPECKVCAVTGGLVCIKTLSKLVLCNPGTKKCLALPELQERYDLFVEVYLGYVEALDVYKVLCVTNKRVGNIFGSKVYRVFTVGSGEDCWRTIGCELQHTPITEGLCKDGVLYYGAWSRSNGDPIVMSFNLGSEELNVIELPKRVRDIFASSLVNYNGDLAFVNRSVDENGENWIWVRNEATRDWREVHIVIPRWRESVGDLCKAFCFKGTIGTGELVFTLEGYIEGSMFVLYYDTVTQHLRKFEIDGVANDCHAETFLDHIDSLLLM